MPHWSTSEPVHNANQRFAARERRGGVNVGPCDAYLRAIVGARSGGVSKVDPATMGCGEDRPLVPATSPDAPTLNERVELETTRVGD